MASMTYYVALAFMRSEGGDIVACEPKEARSSNQAIRMADAGQCSVCNLLKWNSRRPPIEVRLGSSLHSAA
jgi:hypothetical protein